MKETELTGKIIPFSPKKGDPGCMVGRELQVSRTSKITSIRFFLTNYGTPDSPYSAAVYGFSNDRPDIQIADLPINLKQNTDGNEWIEHSLEEVILLPGKYLIAMKWLTSPGEDGTETQTIGFMQSDEEEISWMNWHGQWQKDTGPYKGNFMIESVLEEI